MSRLKTIEIETASGPAKDLLEAVKAKLKITPNMTKVMANSPAVLKAYLSFGSALAEGALSPKLGERIALTVAELNSCEYCLSAHTFIGKALGLSDAEVNSARNAEAPSTKDAAALAFARQLVTKHGHTSTQDIDSVRGAGFSDGEIAEIIAHVALNIFTNHFNNTAGVEVDFPKVALRRSA